MTDIADNSARQFHSGNSVEQVAFHQHNVGRFNCDIRARANCNADVGAGQGRRVVDAVADHRNLFALLLERRDLALLVLRQHLRHDAPDPKRPADRLGSAAVIAGQHHHVDAHRFKRVDRRTARRLDSVRHGHNADHMRLIRKIERRFPLLRQGFALFPKTAHIDAVFIHHARIACKIHFPIDARGDALSGNRFKIGHIVRMQAACLGLGDNRAGKRMLRRLFDRSGKRQKGLL